jgi:rare lipoprotein A
MKTFPRFLSPLRQNLLLCSLSALLLAACSSAPERSSSGQTTAGGYPDPNAGRYSQSKDSIPLRLPTAEEMIDPEPVVEPLSRGGNKAYNIYGVDYYPKTTITEHSETGTASWYGNKFHGHLTSNGETYDVFSMTAAHKTLPLPSYVRVTNLDNYRSAIVRVNDRGPFHDGRVIDLSYSAAYKLGIFQTGTGRVKVELVASPAMENQSSFATPIAQEPTIPYEPVTPVDRSASENTVNRPVQFAETTRATASAVSNNNSVSSSQGAGQNGCFIQLIASSDPAKVQRLGNELQQQWSVPTTIENANGIYKLLAGPLQGAAQAADWLDKLRAGAYPDAYVTNKKLCG